jgi:hypothetical protein
MTQYIQFGEDIVEFPDGMSEADIESALSVASGVSSQEAAPVTAPTNGFLMGLKDPISGGAQLAPRGLAYATSLGGATPNPVSRFFDEEARKVDAMVRAEQQAYMAQRAAQGETGFDVARMAGNVLSPANLAPGVFATRLAAARGIMNPAAQAAIGGAVSGLMQPATEEDFAAQKLEQATLGGAFGAGGQKVVAGAGRMLNPLVSKAEQTMIDLGITPTMGQVLGKGAKSLETFAQYMPIIGTAIQDARQRTIFDFNKGVINKALGRIKTKLPADVIGRDAIKFASDTVSDAYDNVLKKMDFELDFNTSSNILGALNKANLLSPQQRQAAIDYVNDIALSKFSGRKLTGEEYKAIESDLRKKASGLMSSTTEAEREVGDALFGVLGEFKKSLYNQNPKLTPQLRRVDSAYADMSVIKLAAANSGAESGVFTPKQFSTAVRQGDRTLRKSAFAKGTARSQQISDAAMQMLEEEAGATLAGRYAAGGAGLFGLAARPEIAIPAVIGGRMVYSEPGQQLMNMMLRSRPEAVKQAGGMLTRGAPYVGGVVGPQPVYQYNTQERSLPPVEVTADREY